MEILLECRELVKHFPGVTAIDHVNFSVAKGEIHAMIGENGAGKSTLIKILGGVYFPDSGEIFYKGQKITVRSPWHSQQLGIAVIHQELNLVPVLSVAENILLRREPVSENLIGRFWGKVSWKKLFRKANEILQELEINSIAPRTKVKDLSVAQQQLVEIARALSVNASLLIMDEPTTALAGEEVLHLFKVVRKLKNQGVSVVFISHRLDEVFEIADRISVLRDGHFVGTKMTQETTMAEIISMMVGREIKNRYFKKPVPIGETILRVRNLSRKGVIHNISFDLHQGEILGIAGLLGAGRTEMARALFGADRFDNGEIEVGGKVMNVHSPGMAITSGIVLAPEDRKTQGLILNRTVRENISLASLRHLEQMVRINRKKERTLVWNLIQRLDIRTPHMETETQYLSGGNQQKVVLAKWLCLDSKVFIFDEPTKGIDVGAKVEIYKIIEEIAEKGAGIIFISSELPEILAMCDRILVMREGFITAEFAAKDANQEKLMYAATVGVHQ